MFFLCLGLDISSQGAMLSNFLRPLFMNFRNKLECLFLAGLSSLAYYLWVSTGAYVRVEYLKVAPPG
jgi:hypothetical protein